MYFVSPSEQNVNRIAEDLRNGLYERYHLNFISPLPRHQLEVIAQAAIQGDCTTQVAQV